MSLAAFLEASRQLRVGEHRLPGLGEGEVRLRVQACGVCATDLHAWARGTRVGQAGLTGHEIAAIVIEVGEGAGALQVGDQVCVEPNLAVCCGDCSWCREDVSFFCGHKRDLPAWGFAEEIVVPAHAALRIPASVPPLVAPLAEPLACAVHAIRSSAIATRRGGRLEDLDVAIVGAGPLGLLTLAAARHAGARRVFVAARHEHQREGVLRLGGEPVGEDPAELAAKQPRLVLIAAGAGPRVLSDALGSVPPSSEIVVLGLLDEPQPIEARRAVLRGTRLSFSISYGGWGADSDFALGLAVLAREPKAFEFLVSHRFALADVADAFALASARGGRSFRVVVLPGGGIRSG
jgi:threonine dehydrogenase-like Zn-dependent dehydrogenase